MSGGDLANGPDEISTNYNLDGAGVTFDTAANAVHSQSHTVSAEATLGAGISSQKAGAYSAAITLTVSAI